MLSFLPNKKFLADNLPEHRLTQECEIETFGPKRSNVCKTLFTSKQRHSFKKTKWSNLKDYKSRTCTVLQFEKAWEGWCKHSHIENRFSNWLFLRIPLKLALKFLLAKEETKENTSNTKPNWNKNWPEIRELFGYFEFFQFRTRHIYNC